MSIYFFIVSEDPYVKDFLGIVGNKRFNKIILLYKYDRKNNKIEYLGADRYTPERVMLFKKFGYIDLTPYIEPLYKRKPEEIDLFSFDITTLELSKKALKALRKLER